VKVTSDVVKRAEKKEGEEEENEREDEEKEAERNCTVSSAVTTRR